MKPIIAILGSISDTGSVTLKANYSKALERSGALALVIPYTESAESIQGYTEICDGFLFAGGGDVEPHRFGEEIRETCGKTEPKRDELELSIFKAARAAKKPMLGICRGIQLINVALGGSLYQDIPDEIPSGVSHRQTESEYTPSHSVNILQNTPLAKLIGKDKMTANSFHHQAIKRLGDGLSATAVADDGIIEAVSYVGDPYIRAYQWHPERLCDTDADNRKIFDDFVSACKNNRNS